MSLNNQAANERSASDLASSFLNSVGQELTGSEDPHGHSVKARYEDDYYGNRNDYRHSSSRDDYRERSDRRERDRERDRDRDRDRDRHRRKDRDRDRDRGRGRDRESSRRHGGSRERHSRDERHRSSRDDYRSSRHSRRSRSPRRRESRHSSHRSSSRYGGGGAESNVVPLHLRERKLDNWDKAPPGMEGMTAEQVKLTGMFPLPGQVIGTRAPQSFAAPGTYPPMGVATDGSRIRMTQGAAGPAALNATVARQARRLYVGQIPFDIDEGPIASFFNSIMKQNGLAQADSVLAVQINHDKNYAFVEFHEPAQATAAMAFDGIMFNGQPLKIRRPKDYVPGDEYTEQAHVPGLVSTIVPDTPHKIFIGGLPSYLNEEQVMELLKSFGELRAFNLVKDTTTGHSKGFAFCEYADPSVTDLACQGLNNMELGDRKLVVQRASIGAKQGGAGAEPQNSALPISLIPVGGIKEEDATRILQLMNMVTPEELEHDEDYQDIWEDIAEECGKFGTIVDMKIPRPQEQQAVPGLGKVFVRFETKEEALAASRALAGRKFADRTVLTSFTDEDNYLTDNF
ncbi:uncharacterized protein BYT42DRAFT_615241 [Radiomyces spectabilis]|uniref:uncharacterized protein n=1 Tax=Radiomyces spectabilis TaxID=64574 RepID=UPI00221E9352|nr:uncharacterized protein BYT42DRAFT_615241 [Radiomyces spectabilis]KAI8376512.1 hypothetical protein BYT42DRAFT_615241 [Radiomyces spectabilis]